MKGKFLTILAVGALAFGGSVASASAETAAQVITNLGLQYSAAGWSSSEADSASFYITLKSDGLASGGWNALVGAFFDVAHAYDSTFKIGYVLGGGDITVGPNTAKKSTWDGLVTFNYQYTPSSTTTPGGVLSPLRFSVAYAQTAKNGIPYTNTQSFKANPSGGHLVPGPIVGAGLPVLLGLLGFGFWRQRKQDDAA